MKSAISADAPPSPSDGLSVDSPAPLTWTNWKFPVLVAVACIGLGLFCTFNLPTLLGLHAWLPIVDAKWTIQSAQRVSWGALGTVYSINPQYLPLPGFLLVLAPAVALGDHLGYVNSYPFYLAKPSMWIVVVPVFLFAGSMSILGADYLADTLNVTKARRRVLAVAIALFVVIPTCVWAGHPEDLLALGLSCLSISLLIRQRHLGAALALMTAIMMQPWALLLIPILVVATPIGKRLRVLIYAAALPAATALALLASDFHDAYRSLILQPMQGNGQKLPWWWLAHRMVVTVGGITDAVRVGSGPRLLAVATAIAVAVAVRRDIRPGTIMMAASVALVARAAFETQIWCWYLAPAAVFLAIHIASAAGTSKIRWTLGALFAFGFYGFAAAGYNNYSMPAAVGMGLLIVTAAGSLVAANRGLRPRWSGVHLADIRKWRPTRHRSMELVEQSPVSSGTETPDPVEAVPVEPVPV